MSNSAEFSLDEYELIHLIRDLLNTPHQYDYRTKEDHLRLKTRANKCDVQKATYKWLKQRIPLNCDDVLIDAEENPL